MANPFKLETPDPQFSRRSFTQDVGNVASGVKNALTTPLPIFGETKPSPLGFMGAYDRQSGRRITENEPSSNAAVAPTVAYGAVTPRLGREGASAVRAIDNAQTGGGLRATPTPVAAPVGVTTPTFGRIKPIQEEHYSHNNGVVSPVFRGQDTDRVAAHITYAPTDRGTFKKTIRMDGRVGADNALINGEFNRDKMVPGGYNPNAVAAQQGGMAAGQGTAMDRYMAMAKQMIPDAQQASGLMMGGTDMSGFVNARNASRINDKRLALATKLMEVDSNKSSAQYNMMKDMFQMQRDVRQDQRADRAEENAMIEKAFTRPSADGKRTEVDTQGITEFSKFQKSIMSALPQVNAARQKQGLEPISYTLPDLLGMYKTHVAVQENTQPLIGSRPISGDIAGVTMGRDKSMILGTPQTTVNGGYANTKTLRNAGDPVDYDRYMQARKDLGLSY